MFFAGQLLTTTSNFFFKTRHHITSRGDMVTKYTHKYSLFKKVLFFMLTKVSELLRASYYLLGNKGCNLI